MGTNLTILRGAITPTSPRINISSRIFRRRRRRTLSIISESLALRPPRPSTARSQAHVVHSLAHLPHLQLLHALFQVLYVPAALTDLRVYSSPHGFIVCLRPHLPSGIQECSLSFDLLVHRTEGIVVVIHDDGFRREVRAEGNGCGVVLSASTQVSRYRRWMESGRK